ncbi:SDR family oxidoreductase [Thalassoroseus pseudoceratinae]|uniref:SDR family oxidoreductase n=1 Tax=Thalassoroseus pseudoceratinae TaxID=2713176 RepID=UPI0014205D62|nr:SDR family oxidoreductase [Thalassoroseus pseudoceratinae]
MPESTDRTYEVAVVTGATAGVGRAVVEEFAKRHARIGLLARDDSRLQQTVEAVKRLGGEAIAIPTDVADANAVEEAASQVEDTFGPIDIWINNAMTTVFAALEDIEPEEYRRATEVTYLGTVWGTMAALKRMRKRDRGVIVQVGSALSYRAIPLQAPYCGAKFAIRGMTDSLRCELMHEKSSIHITMVQLPAVNTPQFSWCRSKLPKHPQPVPPIFSPEMAAEAIYWSAHQRQREVQLGLPTMQAIEGNKVAPSLADWKLANDAYDGQQTDEDIAPDRPDNLFSPVPGDFDATGRFNDRAKPRRWQWELTKRRGWVIGSLILLMILVIVLITLGLQAAIESAT